MRRTHRYKHQRGVALVTAVLIVALATMLAVVLTTGLSVAEEYVGQGVAELLAREPQLEHGGDGVEPRHRHGRSGVEHDDRAGVGAGDRRHERVLSTGEGEAGAVLALGLPVVVGADDHDGDVS